MSNTIDTNALLSQLRHMAQDAGIPAARPGSSTSAEPTVSFSQMFEGSLRAVNTRSQDSRQLINRFEQGDPGVDLTDVMIAMQKARISFEALTQVRNQMVSAYKDVMSMPV